MKNSGLVLLHPQSQTPLPLPWSLHLWQPPWVAPHGLLTEQIPEVYILDTAREEEIKTRVTLAGSLVVRGASQLGLGPGLSSMGQTW